MRTQKETASAAGIGPAYFNHILHRRCACPPKLAIVLENVTGIDRTVWVWGERKELAKAWSKFAREAA
jgi:hypothetical protein